jgi:hypothetical protein
VKTTPSQEAARKYLNKHLVMPIGENGEFTLLHKKHRLWLCKGQLKDTIVHICRPRKLLHHIQGRLNSGVSFKTHFVGGISFKTPFVGPVTDGSHWHTQKICYKCRSCGKVFEGGAAYIIKVGLKDREKFKV